MSNMLKLSEVITRANSMFSFQERNGVECPYQKELVIAGADMIAMEILSPSDYDEWINEEILNQNKDEK